MKALAVIAALAAAAPAFSQDSFTTGKPSLSFTQKSSCAYAAIMADDSVIVDWSCVKIQAAEYKARRDMSATSAFAFVLEALRNGTAQVK